MKRLLTLLPLFLFLLILRHSEGPEALMPNGFSARRGPAQVSPPQPPALSKPTVATKASKAPGRRRAMHPTMASAVESDSHFELGRGHVLARNIGFVMKNEYVPRMGRLLYQDKYRSYYLKSPEENSPPVAYSPSKDRFYPISKVLKVKKISSDLRHRLLGEGFREFHYLKGLKIMFIESTPEEVLRTYQELKDKGLRVELEVLKEAPRPH